MSFTPEQVLALAPDAAAAKAGTKLADTRHWQELGQSPAAMWGKCQGSALYQVRVDLSDTTASCSCPSRKVPCKHGLGLLLLAAQQPSDIPQSTTPEWVQSWLSKRASAQSRRETKASGAGETAVLDDPAAAKRRVAQSRRTAAARARKVAAGLHMLDLWLNDLMRGGLAGLESRSSNVWEEQASRMVDAQAPGIAARLRALAALPNASPDWPDRLLAALGRLALLSAAYRSLDTLEPRLADDVRALIGWTLNEDEVVARGEAVADEWLVLSDTIGDEDRLRVRRSWLLGAATDRAALILQYATSRDGFSHAFVAGTYQPATLVYYPGAFPQRALVRERSGRPRRWEWPLPGAGAIAGLLVSVAGALARQPWLDRFACLLDDAVVVPAKDGWTVQDAAGDALPLVPGEHWTLLALGGGAPVQLAGEWDGRALRPLGVLVGGRYHALPEHEAGVALRAAGAALEAGPLAALALAGTAKVADKPVAGWQALDEAFAGLPLERERELLLRAAAVEVYQQAGYTAGSAQPAPEPAPVEQCEACSPAVAGLIDRLLGSSSPELLLEAARLLDQARLRLPHTLLPRLLNISDKQGRAALWPVLDERGRWLGRFNPEWSWAAERAADGVPPDAERVWQEGGPSERLALLGRVRAAEPGLARAWIEAVWRQEKAEFRADMLEVVAAAPVPDDEPLLETALDDRSAAVRSRAAALLATLPGSALTARMRERADTLLSLVAAPAGGLRGFVRSVLHGAGAGGVLKATLPPELPKEWQRDGVSAAPPSGTGERSWWLIETLALVTPAHWVQRWGLPPLDLIRLAAGGEESAAVLEGWSRAAALHHDSDWASAFWEHWSAKPSPSGNQLRARSERLAALVPALPRAQAERNVLRAISRLESAGVFGPTIVNALAMPWSVAFGHAFVDVMRTHLTGNAAHTWSGALRFAALALPPETFEHALGLKNLGEPYIDAYYVKPFLATIELRQRLYRELAS